MKDERKRWARKKGTTGDGEYRREKRGRDERRKEKMRRIGSSFVF